ncbi:hypothetical protein Acr_22g0004230 [Actinidia rufa]|uniref:Retrotransposon gag domain-containing protein n=1 Tax=Actinidia rufa TaxID=165716 RepID=A0A7J0GJS1_9ERIC|nr:hypothetical protein Acr_22g0004230 [Actinidia rufa]
MAEQMRIMNENNALLIQHLLRTIYHLFPHQFQKYNDPTTPIVRATILKMMEVLAKHGTGNFDCQALGICKKGAPFCRNPGHLVKLRRKGRSPRRDDQTDLPFTKRVMRTRVFSKFKLPTQLGVYEGKTYPMDHLNSYKNLMSLQGYFDEIMCQAFSDTLKGSARSWFRKLTPGTIDTFGNLSRLFVVTSCRVRQKNASHLFTIHQKETECLKDYVKWFNQAVLEVEDPSDKVVIMAMMERLRPGPLFDSLSKNVPETLSTLQSKADKYIAAEELAEAKQMRRGRHDKRKKPETRVSVASPQSSHRPGDLIKKGYLRKYVADRPLPGSPKRRYGDNRLISGDIQVIHRGFGLGGCSSSSRKRHARSASGQVEEEVYNLSSVAIDAHLPITFNNDDLRGDVKGDQKVARQCFISAMKAESPSKPSCQ